MAAPAATIPFCRKDDGGDLVETVVPVHGAAVRAAIFRSRHAELSSRCGAASPGCGKRWSGTGTRRAGASVLYWHWSPNNGWAMDHEIRGWNECLITYVLAAGSPRYPIDPLVYHRGFAAGRDFLNGKSYYDIELPLGHGLWRPAVLLRITPSVDSIRAA